MKSDVTEGSTKLASAIGDDSDAVICATGFRSSWDLLAPWKVATLDIFAYCVCTNLISFGFVFLKILMKDKNYKVLFE